MYNFVLFPKSWNVFSSTFAQYILTMAGILESGLNLDDVTFNIDQYHKKNQTVQAYAQLKLLLKLHTITFTNYLLTTTVLPNKNMFFSVK